MDAFEIQILDKIREIFSCSFLDSFFKVYTNFGGTAFVVGLTLALIMVRKTRKTGITAGFALIMGIIVSNLIFKNAVQRIRPFEFNKAAVLVANPPHDFSFPSGHGMSSFAVAVSVFFNYKKVGIAALFAASLIAFSRMYLYFHYPTDVLAGILIGIFAAFVSRYLTDKFTAKFPIILKW